ncbi:PEP-CTERM sorting domain-containing protein [Brevifollis gellanilyticus]|uniref:PEP-CTERM protein-sorting domain-containing protein n=1 Tax=Brevifollis gellanilyticus TaxID=748831 RepID=A0A512M9F8_9BACT|nr:PEP-CTERM sorting domain-containing protein [Brevifollis gellanilyticus]GEP43365.1 hypothetical protein BGE01nite_26560 [Brevifollis gellanilyticus]
MKASRFAAILVLAAASLSQGATIISYTATSDPAGSPDGTITAGGSGTTNVWSTSTTAPGGSFAGNSGGNGDGAGAGAGANAWGIWSNTSGQSNAIHTLAGGALSVGQDIGLDFDNGFVDAGATVGVSLRNAANNNLFEFFFTGGNSTYSKNDLAGALSTGLGFTDDGFKFSFRLNSTSGYSASLGATAFSGSLTAGGGDQAITNVRVFTVGNGTGGAQRDLFFNNLTITPEPSRLMLVALGVVLVGVRRRRK